MVPLSQPRGDSGYYHREYRRHYIQEVIRELVEGLPAKLKLITSQSEYVASRGAAELAWRANILD